MSGTDDISELLANQSSLLLFLPVINFAYLSQHIDSNTILVMGTIAALFTAIVYTGVETPHDINKAQAVCYGLSFICWLVLLILSVYLINMKSGTEEYIPEGLFFISIMVICLMIVDLLSSLIINDYEGVLRDYSE